MPELPEVETTRRGIAPLLTGQRVSACVVRQPRLRRPVPEQLPQVLAGRRLESVQRRAKYLLFEFEHGRMIVHLGMSGSLRIVDSYEPPGLHDHVDIIFDQQVLRFRDPRRFGMVEWDDGSLGGVHPLLARLGVEPLDAQVFDARWLYGMTRGVRAPIKQVLMDAHRVVGVGNIYASESLFRARIHPRTPAGRLGRIRCGRLVDAVRTILLAAIEAGGSSLRDFVGGDGRAGYFQQQYFVYGRNGQPCHICGNTIRRSVIGQRSTFWCASCQRP